ncbi:MAG: GAF domain-containing sensor histidine kinase [Chloroflexota bacterium]|nr:MAG: GAF domain-containing sensor histidine kinase [Chloroflexota bacterium]
MQDNKTAKQLDRDSLRGWHQLQEIGLSLNTPDGEEFLDKIVDAAMEWTDSDWSTFLLHEPATSTLYIAPAAKWAGDDRFELPIEGSAAGWILRNGRPLVRGGGAQDHVDYIELRELPVGPTSDLAGVPLGNIGRVVGALEVGKTRAGVSYSQQDVELLEFLASLAAMAIDNSRLLQQTDLIAEFMHELKTPLMALTAASELLARDLVGKKQLELIEIIQRETMRLSKMAQDFLDLTRLESGRAHFTREPVDLTEVIQDVIRLQEAQAAVRDISIKFAAETDLPAIMGDYDRLRQVFLNLTSNAIKYNIEHGQVTINACQEAEDIVVEIADTGPGIAEENLPHLFDRFYRIPDSEGFTKGTGLGLSIAARILQEHGGRIELESALGKGSTFRCHLPL